MADKKIKLEDRMTSEQKLMSKISAFATLHIKTILIVCVAIFIALIAIVIISGASSASRENNLIAVSDYEDKVSIALASGDGLEELITGLQACVKDNSYASQKAQYLIGIIYHGTQKYDEAYDAFIKASEINNKIYLSNVSLLNAAVCKDETKDYNKAIELYKTVIDRDTIGISSRAMFNVGRIYYQEGRYDLAKPAFEALVERYPESELSKIAQNIIDNM